MLKALIAAGALTLCGVAAVVTVPFHTLSVMRQAVDGNDPAALMKNVEMSTFKRNLKKELQRQLNGAQAGSPSPFKTLLRANVAMGALNPTVDAMTNESGIVALMRNQVLLVACQKDRAHNEKECAVKGPAKDAGSEPLAFDSNYVDLHHFEVAIGPKGSPSGSSVVLVLEREGLLSWKLANVRLPPNI